LTLWGNKLEKLPESLAQLHSLKKLDLNFTKIKIVPKFLRQLEKEGLIIYK
jgi:Leucine-rich repeat (LRR) protein